MINHLSELILQESLVPGSVDAQGNRSPLGAPWGVVRRAATGDDQWCVITVRDDAEWSALAAPAGHPEWATTRVSRRRSRPAGDTTTSSTSSSARGRRSSRRRDVMEQLQAVRVPAAVVESSEDLLDDPHLQAHDFVRVILQPGWEPLFVEGDCYRADAARRGLRPSPHPGTVSTPARSRRELLGLDDGEIDRLVAAGVLEVDAQ